MATYSNRIKELRTMRDMSQQTVNKKNNPERISPLGVSDQMPVPA